MVCEERSRSTAVWTSKQASKHFSSCATLDMMEPSNRLSTIVLGMLCNHCIVCIQRIDPKERPNQDQNFFKGQLALRTPVQLRRDEDLNLSQRARSSLFHDLHAAGA